MKQNLRNTMAKEEKYKIFLQAFSATWYRIEWMIVFSEIFQTFLCFFYFHEIKAF